MSELFSYFATNVFKYICAVTFFVAKFRRHLSLYRHIQVNTRFITLAQLQRTVNLNTSV